VSAIVRTVIDSILRRGFLWPNRWRVFLPMEEVARAQADTFPMAAPQGVLCVGVREGRDLVKKDKHLIGGKSDPYVVLGLGGSTVTFREQFVASSVDPVWEYEAAFPVEQPEGLQLTLEVFDHDAGSEDDFMGRTSLQVAEVARAGQLQAWVALEEARHGEVHLTALWRPLRQAASPGGAAVLAVFVDSCRNLELPRGGPPYARFQLRLEGRGRGPIEGQMGGFTSKPRGPAEHPVYQEGAMLLCRSIETDRLTIQVLEHKSGSVLGRAVVQPSYVAEQPGGAVHRGEWRLQDSVHPEAAVILSAKLYYI